jgi:hypothetical protein
MQQKMMCYIGSQSINPCPNAAVTKDAYGMAVCEEHRQIAEMGLEYDGYLLADELLDKAIETMKQRDETGGGLRLLEDALLESREAQARLDREITELDPRK